MGLCAKFEGIGYNNMSSFVNTYSQGVYNSFFNSFFGLLGLNLVNTFAWGNFKMKSFYSQNVNGRLFNVYFNPVGVNAGGDGIFWMTERLRFLPFI